MKKGEKREMYPYRKKVWQGFFLLFAYMLVAGLIAGTTKAIAAKNSADPWMAAFLLGCLFMGISIFFYVSRKKYPHMSWLCLLLSSVACGLFASAWLIGANVGLPFFYIFAAALFPAIFYLLLAGLLSVPGLGEKLWIIVLGHLFWALALFAVGGVIWAHLPLDVSRGKSYVCLLIFSVFALCLVGGAASDANHLRALMYKMAAPVSYLLGGVVFLILCCQSGGDACNGADCNCGGGTSGGKGRNKKIKTSFGSLSAGDFEKKE